MSLAIVSLAYDYSDNDVASWAQQTLMATLSASYLEKPSDIEALRINYTQAAWDPMVNFFHEKLNLIYSEHLTLHPMPLTSPVIVASGNFAGFQGWRVEQAFNVPEFRINIQFSLLILNAKADKEPPFVIQSLSMRVEHY